jgi:5-methylcytosine-specific restriction protein A
MPTYLLTWNPQRWTWPDLPAVIDHLAATGSVLRQWSCGRSKQICQGDRLFLIRLGTPPKGIFASGRAASDWFEAPHWDPLQAKAGRMVHHVHVRLDTLLDPNTEPILPRAALDAPPFAAMHWDAQASGTRIPDPVAAELETLWAAFLHRPVLPQEVLAAQTYPEGATTRIAVNRYERQPHARQQCIDHFGLACAVCNFRFAAAYGAIGEGFIEVHHVTPLSQVGDDYQVDPIHDLRPVCPNCHAMLHRHDPPYTIAELRARLAEVRQAQAHNG